MLRPSLLLLSEQGRPPLGPKLLRPLVIERLGLPCGRRDWHPRPWPGSDGRPLPEPGRRERQWGVRRHRRPELASPPPEGPPQQQAHHEGSV